MKEKILILGYPDIGKTYISDNYKNVIDFEHQYYRFIYDEDVKHLPFNQFKQYASKRTSNKAWPNNFVEAVNLELKKCNNVIIS